MSETINLVPKILAINFSGKKKSVSDYVKQKTASKQILMIDK